jgi:hypothetical protein
VLGLTVGGGFGRGAGYPNNSNDIGKSDYASSAWLPGTGDTLFVMGALADYFSFGFWFGRATFSHNEERATQSGVGLRAEAFPLLLLCPRLAGLGLLAQFGIGTGKLTNPGADDVGGTQSFIGVGTFYEWSLGHVLGGHFGLGPSLEYDDVFSQPYDQSAFVATARVVFYGGP